MYNLGVQAHVTTTCVMQGADVLVLCSGPSKTDDLPLLYAIICHACCQLKPQDRISIDTAVQKLKLMT